MERNVKKIIQGHPTQDGAGVKLTRVIGAQNVYDVDPFLMLDAFDSNNPNDYVAGFPFHPHRGIETFTYLIEGLIEHQDSLGNKGVIHSGEAQWMTPGSSIKRCPNQHNACWVYNFGSIYRRKPRCVSPPIGTFKRIMWNRL